jgi:hypothetical protein
MWPDNSESGGEERADWAIVFVHGIGEQSPGSTLERFGPPVAAYARAHSGPQSALVRRPEGWGLTLDDGAAKRRWLLLEVHWADVVGAPTYRQLLRWLVLVAPWVLHTDALLWSERRARRPRKVWWALFYYSYVWVAKVLWAFLRGMLLLIAGLVAQLVLTVVGVLGLVPALRGPARWVQRALIDSVGDSFAYLFDESTWRRIERRLVETIEYARPRAHRIAVVTHSQGTAVMHRALAGGRIPDRVAIWVSLGSGLQKLVSLRETTAQALVGWAAFRAVALGLLLASIPSWDRVRDPLTGEDVPTELTIAAVMFAIAILVAPYWSVRRNKRRLAQLIREPLQHGRLRWVDLYSFHDPVPGGPIPGTHGDATEQPIASVQVYNEESFLRDHSAYAGNVEEVVRRVHDLLEPTRALDPVLARRLEERRARRVRLRRLLLFLAAGTTGVLSASFMFLAPWTAVDMLAVVVAGLLSYVVLDGAWRRWHREATALAVVTPGGRTRIGRLAWIVVGWSLLALLGMMALFAVLDLPQIPGWQQAIGGFGIWLTLPCCLLAVIMLLTLDDRAREAAQRPLPGPWVPSRRHRTAR